MNSHPRVLGRTIGFLCTIAASQASASPLSPEAPPSKPAPAASSQATPSWAQPENSAVETPPPSSPAEQGAAGSRRTIIRPSTPVRLSEQPYDPEGDLELAVRTLNNFLSHPSPYFRGAVGLHDDAVITFIKRTGTPVRLGGVEAGKFLTAMFDPDRVTVRFAAPMVRVEGRYGIVTRKLAVREGKSREECLVLHADAWETGRGWRFLSINLAVMGNGYKCEFEDG